MRRLLAWMLLCVGLAVAVHVPPAAAQLAVDKNPTLTTQEAGGWSGTLGLTNLTREGLQLDAAATGCEPSLSKAAISAAQALDVKATVPSGCKPDAAGKLSFTIAVEGAETGTQSVLVEAETKPAPEKPAWEQLRIFPIAVVAAFVLLGLFIREPPLDGLDHLPSSYSFKESWVANVTVVAALVTSVFGTVEVVKAFLGPDAESSIALATVGSAIALALIGAGPIVLLATRRRHATKRAERVFTVVGLLAAFAVTAGAAFGQLWIGWKAGRTLELDGVEDAAFWAFVLGALLLVGYTLTTLRATIEAGRTAPTPSKSELEQINETLREALLSDTAVPNPSVPGILERLHDEYPTSDWPMAGTSRGDDMPRRRHAAMP